MDYALEATREFRVGQAIIVKAIVKQLVTFLPPEQVQELVRAVRTETESELARINASTGVQQLAAWGLAGFEVAVENLS
ncbi:MAG: hypothetical protein OXQ31_10890 [Spirochaetaceae bacterium]|nr:hypothetical protein [Spirochaetaceae bacterium]